MTINQLVRHGRIARSVKEHKNRQKSLSHYTGKKAKPFVSAICISLKVMSPKKPNSAKRTVGIFKYNADGRQKKIAAYVPGENHGTKPFEPNARVLIRAGRRKDLPGIRHMVVRGVYDCKPVKGMKNSVSKYGKFIADKR